MEKNVILLHGFGEDQRVFGDILPKLSASFKVFTPDLPGSGSLSGISFEPSLDSLADWLLAYTDSKGIDKFVLLGHSMGGYIALAFAEKYADRLQGLGLLHSTAYADSQAKKEMRLKAIDFMEQKTGFTFLKTAIPGLFAPDFAQQNPEVVDHLVALAAGFTTASLQQYYLAMANRPDRSIVLANAKIPVLIIAGSEDNAAPVADLSAQAALPAICHFSILQNTGHMGMLENPDDFATIINTYLGVINY